MPVEMLTAAGTVQVYSPDSLLKTACGSKTVSPKSPQR